MDRKQFEKLVLDAYDVKADYPFEKDFETAIFRHVGNKKWFAAVLRIPKSKLGLCDDGVIDIVDLKCAPEVVESLAGVEAGIFRAYHMNKIHWLTVALDGSCDSDTIAWLLDISYELTKPKVKKRK